MTVKYTVKMYIRADCVNNSLGKSKLMEQHYTNLPCSFLFHLHFGLCILTEKLLSIKEKVCAQNYLFHGFIHDLLSLVCPFPF